MRTLTYSPTQLRETRRALGMTQATLANRIGVTPTTVHRWEAGKFAIPVAVAELLEHWRAEGRPPP